MITRTISGIIFVLVVTGALFLGYTTSLVLFTIIGILGTLEFYALTPIGIPNQSNAYHILGTIFSGILILTGGYLMIYPDAYWVISIWIFFGVLFVIQLLRSNSPTTLIDISITLSGCLYLSIPLLSLLALGAIPNWDTLHFEWKVPMSVFILTWINDTGAYLAGRTWGKTKLFERISPNKTWEGTVGGGLATLIVSVLIHYYWGILSIPLWLGAGLLISIFSNVGDLMESAFKRNASVKDSGKIMPGHGGILDRFDAILLIAPVLLGYYILITIYRH